MEDTRAAHRAMADPLARAASGDAVAAGAALLAATTGAMVTSRCVDWRRAPFVPLIQPRGPAFGIWALLFGLAWLRGGWLLLRGVDDAADLPSAWLHAAAFALCAVWTGPASRQRWAPAAASLLAAAIVASVGAAAAPAEDVLGAASCGLLAAWLTFAAALNLILAEGADSALDRPPTLGAAGLLIAGWAVPRGNVAAPLVTAWVALWSPRLGVWWRGLLAALGFAAAAGASGVLAGGGA